MQIMISSHFEHTYIDILSYCFVVTFDFTFYICLIIGSVIIKICYKFRCLDIS